MRSSHLTPLEPPAHRICQEKELHFVTERMIPWGFADLGKKSGTLLAAFFVNRLILGDPRRSHSIINEWPASKFACEIIICFKVLKVVVALVPTAGRPLCTSHLPPVPPSRSPRAETGTGMKKKKKKKKRLW